MGGIGKAGEDIIIGMATRLLAEAPSFSDRDANGKLVYQNIPHWKASAIRASVQASHCNQKVIGARYYNEVSAAPQR